MSECKIKNCDFRTDSNRSFIYHIKSHKLKNLREYYIKYGGVVIKKCIYCQNESSWNNKIHEFRNVCGNKSCIGKYAQSISKRKIKEKYGVDNPGQLQFVKDKVKKTKLDRYGSETYNNMDKNKNTCLKRYGVDNGAKSKMAREKISKKYQKSDISRKINTIKTFQKKYGVDWNFQSDDTKKKKKITFLKNWGVDHPMKNKEYFDQRKIKFKKKYGVEYLTQLDGVRQKISNTHIKKRRNILLDKFKDIVVGFPDKDLIEIKCFECKKNSILNIGFMIQRNKFSIDLCLHCTPYKIQSHKQIEIAKWIRSMGFNVIENYKIPNTRKEIDIFIPDLKIGIEYNGLYWHGEIHKSNTYHKDKKMLGILNSINIINIWEDEYLINENRIKKRIKNLLGVDIKKIGARECSVIEIDNIESKIFLDDIHIQGSINSKLRLGMFYKDKLVSVMTFGRRNGLKENEWEIFRYAIKSNYKINGGFNKLFKYFLKKYNPLKIRTYADLDWTNYRNNVYENNNFIFIDTTPPRYMYVIGNMRENRIKYQKHKLIQQGYDKSKTEAEIMASRGYYRIFDCGNLKYEWNQNLELNI